MPESATPFLREELEDSGPVRARVDALRAAAQRASEADDRLMLARTLGTLGDLLRALGKADEAVPVLERAVALEITDSRVVRANRLRLATARFYAGAHASAEAELRSLLCDIERSGDAAYLDFTWQHLGKCLAEQQRWREAVACFETSTRLRAGGDAGLLHSAERALRLAQEQLVSARRAASPSWASRHRIALHGAIEGFRRYEDVLAGVPLDVPLEGQTEGSVMLYSSGTTGKPKGVRQPLLHRPFGDPVASLRALGLLALFTFREGDRYLCPAPLYHAAPLAFSAGLHRLGGTSVVMRQFDPEQALRTIQDQSVSTSQWVPTHFKRLLQLPGDVRARYDLSSHRVAVHAAAPCSIPVKRAMIEWWSHTDILEYYAGTEGGGTLIRSAEWQAHPGSVGRHWANGKIHILDEQGAAIEEPLKDGAIYFEAGAEPALRFRYYKDDAKTSEAFRGNLFTLGDIGHLDAEGFLYLTDRQSNMIISGGVNIYPQETENVLIAHAKVSDVAVIGVPNDEMGEEVKAVVIPAPGVQPGPELERELIEHCREQIAHYKCPHSIDFAPDLPRQPTGKLYKRMIRARYWQDRESALV